MKSMMYRLSWAMALAILLSSCVKQPRPCFNAPEVVEVGEPVEFINCSQEAYSYLWQFDDGTESQEANPTHTYTQRGKYLVYLTAYSKNGLHQKKANQVIEVGNRFLDQYALKAVPFGTAWDVADGPDLKLLYGPVSTGGSQYVTAEQPDAGSSDLPIIWMSNTDVMFTDEDWSFTLVDVDAIVNDTIAQWVLNPTDLDKDSPITVNSNNPGFTEMDIEYEVR